MMGDISEIRTRAWATRREKYGPSGGAMKGSVVGRKTTHQAKGVSLDGCAHVYANCGFDPETFEAIRARAVRGQTSFAEQVRTLVEWGLEAEQESERPAAGKTGL